MAVGPTDPHMVLTGGENVVLNDNKTCWGEAQKALKGIVKCLLIGCLQSVTIWKRMSLPRKAGLMSKTHQRRTFPVLSTGLALLQWKKPHLFLPELAKSCRSQN